MPHQLKIALFNGSKIFLAVIFYWIPFSEAQAQNQADSISVAVSIDWAHTELRNRNYQQAIELAKTQLTRSVDLNFAWGKTSSLLILAQCYKSLNNYPEALNYYLQSLSDVERQHDVVQQEWVNIKIGELFQEWRVPEKALPYYQAALQLHKSRTSEHPIYITTRLAEIHLSLNERDSSLQQYFHLIEWMKEKKDTLSLKEYLAKVASIYYRYNDIQNSLRYNMELLEITRHQGDNVGTAVSLNVIGNQYKDLNNPDKALEFYQEALKINRESNSSGANDNTIVTNLINIGVIYQGKGDARSAIRVFREALEIKKKRGTAVEVAVMHNYLASLYLSMSNFSEAEDNTKQAIALLTQSENKRLLAVNYKRLSEIYGRQSNYEKALVNYQIYTMIKDSLVYQEQLQQETQRLKELIVETTEKEAKLSLIDQEIRALTLQNEKELAEREKQQVTLLLKEQELQNVSLQNKQLEQVRAVQHLQLQQEVIEKEKQAQAILLLEQQQSLQAAELQRRELVEQERQQEIAFKNTELALRQAQLDKVNTRQEYLIYTSVLFFALIVVILAGYFIKRRDNQILQTQFSEINRQKTEIESINKSLIELNEEKNDLIGIVAHDLKSPLNQISGMLEIIKLTTRDNPEQSSYVAEMDKSAQRLKRMVTKILDVSAIESQALNIKIEKVIVQNLLTEVVDRFEPQALKKDIAIVREWSMDLSAIETDSGYLSEVIDNLMSNAIKYSPLHKKVFVRLKGEDKWIRLEFEDQGQGINENDMKNLFGKYRKLSAKPTAGEDSTGLGLSIVKKYVLALHGQVWCESEVGKGSIFIVRLPA